MHIITKWLDCSGDVADGWCKCCIMKVRMLLGEVRQISPGQVDHDDLSWLLLVNHTSTTTVTSTYYDNMLK